MTGSKRPSSRLSSVLNGGGYTEPYVPKPAPKIEAPILSEPLLSKPLLTEPSLSTQNLVHQQMMKTMIEKDFDESSKSEPFTEDSLSKSEAFIQATYLSPSFGWSRSRHQSRISSTNFNPQKHVRIVKNASWRSLKLNKFRTTRSNTTSEGVHFLFDFHFCHNYKQNFQKFN